MGFDGWDESHQDDSVNWEFALHRSYWRDPTRTPNLDPILHLAYFRTYARCNHLNGVACLPRSARWRDRGSAATSARRQRTDHIATN